MTAIVIEGARAILPDRVERVSVRVEAGRITGLDVPAGGARVCDARGLVLAPALVDLCGEGLERQIMPRPGQLFPVQTALIESDRQLAANGIATGYHALTLSWEPGLRSLAQAAAVLEALARLAPRLTVENRVQLRWETFCFEAEPLIARALAGLQPPKRETAHPPAQAAGQAAGEAAAQAAGQPGEQAGEQGTAHAPLAPALAFTDHLSEMLHGFHPPARSQALPPALRTLPGRPPALDHPQMRRRVTAQAQRAGQTIDDYLADLSVIWGRRAEVPAAVDRTAAQGRSAGVPMLSQGDCCPEMRARYAGLGARIAQFPRSCQAAAEARARGEWVALSAAQALLGSGHGSGPHAETMIARDCCDILASDFYPPAMLAVVARLAARGTASLPGLWQRISANPARALGLTDRGEIAPGKRADLVLLDWPEGGPPAVRATLSAGRVAYAAGGLPA